MNYTEFYKTLAGVDMDDYKALRTVLKEARDVYGLPVGCKLNAKKDTLVEAAMALLDHGYENGYYEGSGEDEADAPIDVKAVEVAATPKQRFLEACANAPRPGSLVQTKEERIDSLVQDDPEAGYDSAVYLLAAAEEVPDENDTDILAVYLLAAAWAVGALALAVVVSVIFIAKMAFKGIVAGLRAYHDICFSLGTRWAEYEALAVKVPAIG